MPAYQRRRYFVNEIGSGTPLPIIHRDVCRGRKGLLGIDLLGQAGNFSGSRAFVQNTFFCRFIDDGLGDVEPLNGIFRILRRGEIQILDDIFNTSLNGFVALAPLLTLNGAL